MMSLMRLPDTSGESEVASGVAVGEAFVVESELVENGGV